MTPRIDRNEKGSLMPEQMNEELKARYEIRTPYRGAIAFADTDDRAAVIALRLVARGCRYVGVLDRSDGAVVGIYERAAP
jgi:hypothetical protein